MSGQNTAEIDINLASREELTRIPGVSRVLAERIIQARPFARLEDLRRVRGIGARSLESMLPYLTLAEAAGEHIDTTGTEEPEAAGESAAPAGSAEPPMQTSAPAAAPAEQMPLADVPAERPVPPAPVSVPPPAGGPYLRRVDALWWGAGLGIFVLILAVIFSLGVLNIVNNTLSYAPASQVRALDDRAARLSDQIEILDGDLVSLRARLDAMESLSGRVAGLEEESQALRRDLQQVQAQTEALQSRSEELSRQVAELEKSSAVFQNFLDGLRRLLNENTP